MRAIRTIEDEMYEIALEECQSRPHEFMTVHFLGQLPSFVYVIVSAEDGTSTREKYYPWNFFKEFTEKMIHG